MSISLWILYKNIHGTAYIKFQSTLLDELSQQIEVFAVAISVVVLLLCFGYVACCTGAMKAILQTKSKACKG